MHRFLRPSFKVSSVISILVLCLLLASCPASAGLNQWTSSGPEGGYIKVLAIDPSTPATLYAGTYGGVFKSVNGGGNWSPVNTGLTNLSVYALAIDPSTPATLYAGTGGGVFKSVNAGGNWSQINTGLTNLYIRALAIDPSIPATLYAGTAGGGVFKSVNGGENWSPVNTGLTDLYVYALAIDPSTPATLYAGTYDGVFEWSYIPLSGTIKDSSGNSLADVTVSAGGVSAKSDTNGYYALGSLSPGTYDVAFAKSGFFSVTASAVTINAGESAIHDVTLYPLMQYTGSVKSFIEVSKIFLLSLSATGGSGNYTYSIISGQLPSGLTLETSTGRLTGIPTNTGTYDFTFRVDDGEGQIIDKTFHLEIHAPSWPMRGHDPAHTGQSEYTEMAFGELKWRYLTGGSVNSSPTIGSDGTVYVGSDDGYLYALNPNGTLKWRYQTGSRVSSSPAIASDSTVYVGSDDGCLYAFNPNGTLKWSYPAGWSVRSSPAIGSDGTVYVGSWGYDDYLYALNPDGTLKWRYKTIGLADTSPAIGSDGTVYFASDRLSSFYLYALNPNGTLKWYYAGEGYMSTSPAIASNGTVYFGASATNYNKYLYALNPDGTLKWIYDTVYDAVSSSPAIGSDGTVYVGSDDSYLYAFHLQSQGGIGGIVRSMATNLGAPVALSAAPTSNALSRSDGHYTLIQAPGTYSLTVSGTGYQTLTIPFIVVKAGDVTPLDILIPTTGTFSITRLSFVPGSVGQSYKDRAWVAGGTYPYVFSVSYGTLPPGCILDAASGFITGTPTTPGSYTFAIGVRDQQNGYLEVEYTIDVTAPLVFTTPSPLPRATKNQPYLQDLQITGGTFPYSLSVISGALPSGLSMTPAGRISGRPTVAGDFTVTIKLTDASGRTLKQNFALPVDNPFIIATSMPTFILGTNWNLRTSGITKNLESVVFGNNIFVAVGKDGAILTSQDGITWSQGAIGTYWIKAVTYGNGIFVAVGDSGKIWKSADAVNWTEQNSGTTSWRYAVTYYNNKFMTVGWDTTIQFSDDGTTWTSRQFNTPNGSSCHGGIIGGNDKVVIVSGCMGEGIFTSSDGITWNKMAPLGVWWYDITHGSDIFVAVGDGLSSATSSDGLTWVRHDSQLSVNALLSITYGNNTFASVGMNGIIVTSNDGIAWTKANSPISNVLRGISYGNNAFVAVGDNGAIIQSDSITTSISNPLNTAIAGQAYNQTLQVSGGYGPYTWSVYSGNLPAGLSLNASTGVISGTPQTASTTPLVIMVEDSAGRQSFRNMTLIVTAPLAFVTTTLPNGARNETYSEQILVSGGLAPYQFTFTGTLPTGLSLNQTTGVISGTPTVAMLTNIQITMTDSSLPTPQTATATLALRVTSTLTINSSAVLPTVRLDQAIAPVVLRAVSGVSPYQWSLTAGSLPPGLSLDPATGQLTGTPTAAGDYVFTIKVTDSKQPMQAATKEFIYHVARTLTIDTNALPDGGKDVFYSYTLPVSGGRPNYAWRVKTGTLLAGLTLDAATGTIAGKPTAAAAVQVTIAVTDGDTPAQTAEKIFAINISDKLLITTPNLPNGRLGQAYTANVNAALGTPPYSFAVTEGYLPMGLSMKANAMNATISGTPTEAGTAMFKVTVTDNGVPVQTSTKQYTVNVYSLIDITTTKLPNALKGENYDQTIAVTGGLPPYTWFVSAGQLPAGLTLDSATGKITGIPSAAPGTSAEFTIRVSDAGIPALPVQKQFVIYVLDPMTITSNEIQGALQQADYSATLAGFGGLAPFTWAVSQGTSLPEGMTMNGSTGIISGKPAVCGEEFNFTVRLTDAGSIPLIVEKAFTLTILCSNDYKLTGTIPAATGVKVKLTGAAIKEALTDANGNYTFEHLPGGAYTVTPIKPSFGFNPESKALQIARDTTLDFTLFKLWGDIDGDSRLTISDAILALKTIAGIPGPPVYPEGSKGGKISLQDVIYIMQLLAGLRQKSNRLVGCHIDRREISCYTFQYLQNCLTA